MSTKPNPVELDFSAVAWEKSPFSGGSDNCVEFGVIGEFVALRDSKRPEQTPHVYTRSEIAAFLAGAKAGALDHLVRRPAATARARIWLPPSPYSLLFRRRPSRS